MREAVVFNETRPCPHGGRVLLLIKLKAEMRQGGRSIHVEADAAPDGLYRELLFTLPTYRPQYSGQVRPLQMHPRPASCHPQECLAHTMRVRGCVGPAEDCLADWRARPSGPIGRILLWLAPSMPCHSVRPAHPLGRSRPTAVVQKRTPPPILIASSPTQNWLAWDTCDILVVTRHARANQCGPMAALSLP